MGSSRRQSVIGEFASVSLGDRRLDRRLAVVVGAMESAPGDSLVEQAATVGALEATYRFLSNDKVRPEAIFEGHAARTVARTVGRDSVLVIHDTTEFRFGGAKERRGLGRISSSKRDGFLAHYSICVSREGEPLGGLELFAWSRLDDEKRSKARGGLRAPERESLRWGDSVERASARLFERTSPIHVMDREGDQFELFAALRDEQHRFVIRLGHDRRLKKGRGRDGHAMLHEVLGSGPACFTRQVRLGRRERERATKKQRVFPERETRTARLEVRARRIELHRSHQHAEHLPDCLTLNFIEAREVGAPANATPVIWRLVTTEPIDTDAQIGEVIDIYRMRWLIEEFFKALKTGCRFESHQLEDIKGLLVALAIESAIAWQILRLRWVARHDTLATAQDLVTSLQERVVLRLRRLRGLETTVLTAQDVIEELSRLGAHLPNNGPPGWAVLKRGLRRLDLLAEGLSLAQEPSTM